MLALLLRSPASWLAALLIAAAPYLARAADKEADPAVDAPTEEVLKGSLKWLASKQSANGSWSVTESGRQVHPVAMTGYVLLAFLATGNLPEEGEYSANVTAAMQFLLDSVQPDGTFRGVDGSKYMYNHGIATIALSELYGQTRSAAIRPKLERLIQLIIRCQSPEGGWRYAPAPQSADISATVPQVVALRAAKNAGIEVPQKTIDAAVAYVKNCQAENGGFAYQPGKGAGFARTAAAIYSLQVCGQYDDPLVLPASQYLFENKDQKSWWTYGNYYAAPAQYMIGGDTWRKWYTHVKATLLPAVMNEGGTAHWEPTLDGGTNGVGDVYCTAVYTTILAMPYRYIPLYQR